jgi:hypothetical protein
MSMNVKEIKRWLESLSDLDEVGVDDGGLCLRSVQHPNVYCEIGGIPEDAENDCDNCRHKDQDETFPNCASCVDGIKDGWEPG